MRYRLVVQYRKYGYIDFEANNDDEALKIFKKEYERQHPDIDWMEGSAVTEVITMDKLENGLIIGMLPEVRKALAE